MKKMIKLESYKEDIADILNDICNSDIEIYNINLDTSKDIWYLNKGILKKIVNYLEDFKFSFINGYSLETIRIAIKDFNTMIMESEDDTIIIDWKK